MDDVYLPESITEEDVQELITSNVAELSAIEKQANKASEKAKVAKEKAEEVRKLETGHVFNKKSVEALKESNLDLAEALECSTQAQVRMQQHQTALTKFMTFILQVSVSSVAAGDAAIERLQQIVSDNKKAKELGNQTKERIDEIISSIKNQQTLFKKLDDVKKRISDQQSQIALLSQRIDSLSVTSDENGDINISTIIASLNEPFKQVIAVCNENSETIKDCFESLNNYLIGEVASVKNTIVNKSNNSEAILNEHMFIIRDYFKRTNDSYVQLLEDVSSEAAIFKSKLEEISDKCKALEKQNSDLSEKIEQKDKQNALINKRTNIILFISLGIIALLVIACLIVACIK